MKSQDLRNLSVEELRERLRQTRTDFFNLQMAVESGKEKNHAKLGELRRGIARAKTVLKEMSRDLNK